MNITCAGLSVLGTVRYCPEVYSTSVICRLEYSKILINRAFLTPRIPESWQCGSAGLEDLVRESADRRQDHQIFPGGSWGSGQVPAPKRMMAAFSVLFFCCQASKSAPYECIFACAKGSWGHCARKQDGGTTTASFSAALGTWIRSNVLQPPLDEIRAKVSCYHKRNLSCSTSAMLSNPGVWGGPKQLWPKCVWSCIGHTNNVKDLKVGAGSSLSCQLP